MASRFSIVPRSRSRVMASAVIITIVMVSTTPIRPGTMLYCVIASGLYLACTRISTGSGVPAKGASGPLRSLARAVSSSVRREPTALRGRGRVGGVGLDENDRPVAAKEVALEVHGDGDQELHLAAGKRGVPFGLGGHLADEGEVAAVADGLQDGAGVRAVVGDAHGGGQVTRVGVDREAEEHELHERHAEHHAEGEPVAAHLHEFLDDDGPESSGGEADHDARPPCSMR